MITRVLAVAAALVVTAAPHSSASPAPAPVECTWLAGDLHVHTTYSHDSYGGPGDDNTGHDEFYTFGWSVAEQGAIASSRGLDYLAITDHNDTRSATDPGYGSNGLIWVPGYENSLAGHAQMLGTTTVLDNGAGTLADVERVAEQLRSTGGVFQINHPSDGEWESAYGFSFVPDTIEAWNIGAWYYQHPLPATNDHELALDFWDRFLDAGHRVGATGGSDNHWRTVTPAAGVGQPTTWTCAVEPTTQGVLDALDAGRTTISHQPPAYGGAFAELRADGDGNGTYEAGIGEVVKKGSAILVRVNDAAGAIVRLVGDGGRVLHEQRVTSPSFSTEYEAPRKITWLRAEVFYEDAAEARNQLDPACEGLDQVVNELGQPPTTYCQNRLAVVALTSPIYLGKR